MDEIEFYKNKKGDGVVAFFNGVTSFVDHQEKRNIQAGDIYEVREAKLYNPISKDPNFIKKSVYYLKLGELVSTGASRHEQYLLKLQKEKEENEKREALQKERGRKFEEEKQNLFEKKLQFAKENAPKIYPDVIVEDYFMYLLYGTHEKFKTRYETTVDDFFDNPNELQNAIDLGKNQHELVVLALIQAEKEDIQVEYKDGRSIITAGQTIYFDKYVKDFSKLLDLIRSLQTIDTWIENWNKKFEGTEVKFLKVMDSFSVTIEIFLGGKQIIGIHSFYREEKEKFLYELLRIYKEYENSKYILEDFKNNPLHIKKQDGGYRLITVQLAFDEKRFPVYGNEKVKEIQERNRKNSYGAPNAEDIDIDMIPYLFHPLKMYAITATSLIDSNDHKIQQIFYSYRLIENNTKLQFYKKETYVSSHSGYLSSDERIFYSAGEEVVSNEWIAGEIPVIVCY